MLTSLGAGLVVVLALAGWPCATTKLRVRGSSKRNSVASYIAESGVELAKDDLISAVQRAIAAAETEAEYVGDSARRESDEALRRVLAQDRLILHIKRESLGLPEWPFEFVDDNTLIYATKNGGLFALDLPGRRVAWRLDLPNLSNPRLMKIGDGGGTIYVANEHSLAVVSEARQNARFREKLDFEEPIRALSISNKRSAARRPRRGILLREELPRSGKGKILRRRRRSRDSPTIDLAIMSNGALPET